MLVLNHLKKQNISNMQEQYIIGYLYVTLILTNTKQTLSIVKKVCKFYETFVIREQIYIMKESIM